MARKKQTVTELKLYQIDTMVYLGTKNIITKLSMFAEFLKEGGVTIADQLQLNRARALERFDKNYKITDIEELTIDGQANETWLRKNGLLNSVGGKYELSPIAKAILKEKISLADYCFLLLSKQWIKIKIVGGKDEYKDNLLSFILSDLLECKSIPESDFIAHIGQIALNKYKNSYNGLELSNQEAARYLIEPLLISKLITISNGNFVISPNIVELVTDYVSKANGINRIDQVSCADEEYWNSFQYGFYDIINEDNKSLYIKHYPNLFGMKGQNKNNGNPALQQIFYGAPGTGKSHSIKDDENVKVAEEKKLVVRTTFHPDSDYSTFVGAYKPSMKTSERTYTPEELAVKLKEIKDSKVIYPCQKFGAQYWNSLKDISAAQTKQILKACGFTNNMIVEVGKGVAIGQEYLNSQEDGKIIYTFCPQAFTNAYVKAWNKDENVYLVIEEINRGNCAQIFGDLFQLLDRGDDNRSKYPIDADTDLAAYIADSLKDSRHYKIPDEVKNGKKLMLPENLYIWATMNTSDQSLFPIDSAFKRRWDWEYIPIGYKNTNWEIVIGENKYKWVDFQRKINDKIYSVDNSEDKQLGDYFVNADLTDNIISSKTLLNKILFYIWNDVCKDDPDQIFRWKDDKDHNQEKSIKFSEFFCDEDERDRKLQGFMAFLRINANGDSEVNVVQNDDTTTEENDEVVNS